MKLDINSESINQHRVKIFFTSHTFPLKYKVYKIPKRSAGFRVIAQPTKEVKEIQRAVVDDLKNSLSIHPCAMAYVDGKSIKDNALAHAKNSYILKMDFEDFFHSITPALFKETLIRDGFEFSEQEFNLLKNVFFWAPAKKLSRKLILSIGAPSSPFVSNYVMKFFDEEMYTRCKQQNVVYTRYADDLTFSTKDKNVLFNIKHLAKKILKEQGYNNITINESKTVFSSKAHNRHVTGVTLTNEGRISVGRKNKRLISSLIFKFKLNELHSDEILTLKGMLAHTFHLEDNFKKSMIRKYGDELINQIVKYKEENNEQNDKENKK